MSNAAKTWPFPRRDDTAVMSAAYGYANWMADKAIARGLRARRRDLAGPVATAATAADV